MKMSEINEINETPKSRKPWFIGAGVAVAIALAIGGIAINANGNANPDAAPSVTATATASPSETATPSASATQQPMVTDEGARQGLQHATEADKAKLLAQFASKPLGVDIDEVMENRLADDVVDGPTKFTEAEVRAGVASTLNAYQELASITAWAHARDGAQDVILIAPFGEATETRAAFSAEMMAQMKADIEKREYFSFGVSTVAPTGSVKIGGVTYQTDESSIMNSKSNQPAVSISRNGEMLHIEGTRYYTISLADGKTLIGQGSYHFDDELDRTSGTWIIKNFGESPDVIKVVSDEEAATWMATNG
jgi:hypothetical protein